MNAKHHIDQTGELAPLAWQRAVMYLPIAALSVFLVGCLLSQNLSWIGIWALVIFFILGVILFGLFWFTKVLADLHKMYAVEGKFKNAALTFIIFIAGTALLAGMVAQNELKSAVNNAQIKSAIKHDNPLRLLGRLEQCSTNLDLSKDAAALARSIATEPAYEQCRLQLTDRYIRGENLLEHAINYQSSHVIDFLLTLHSLRFKAFIYEYRSEDNRGNSRLLACQSDQTQLTSRRPTFPSSTIYSAIIKANNVELLQLFLKVANVCEKRDLFWVALGAHHLEYMQAIVASGFVPNNDGVALYVAARNKKPEMFHWLMTHYTFTNHQKLEALVLLLTPFQRAFDTGFSQNSDMDKINQTRLTVIKALEKTINFNEFGPDGKTPLMYGMKGYDTSNQKYEVALLKLLIARGANIQALDKKGRSVLHYATHAGSHREIIDELVNHGAVIDQVDFEGNNILFRANLNSFYHLVREREGAPPLLDLNAVNHQNNKGETILHYFILYDLIPNATKYIEKNGYIRAATSSYIRHLVQSGVDVSLKDHQGKTAMDYLEESGLESLVMLLIQETEQNQ